MISGERVTIVRSGIKSKSNPMSVGSKISGEEGAIRRADIYQVGDFGISKKITSPKERAQAIKEIQAGSTKYITDTSRDPMVGSVARPAQGFYGSVASRNGIESYSELFVRNGPITNKNPMSTTGRVIQKAAINAKALVGEKSKVGNIIGRVVDTENLGTSFNSKNRFVSVNENVRTVELPEKLKTAIITDSKSGRITDEHKQAMYDLAYEQSGKYKEPVAIIPPKTAAGWQQAENEIFVVVHPDANKITAKKFAGYTRSGIKVEKIAIGEQKLTSSVLGNLKENLGYNYAVGVDKYGLYNKKLQSSENYNMQRRINELSVKTTVAIEGGYEHGRHGQAHANAVERNMNIINSENPHLSISKDTSKVLGQYHDVAKIGLHDNPLTSHGTTAARAIRTGAIHSEELNSLTKTQRVKAANDIAYHDLNKPLSSGNLLGYAKTKTIYRPTKEAKVLSNADRMDLVRFGIKVDKNQLFDVSYKRSLGNALVESSKDIASALGQRRMMRDESAEVFITGRSRLTEGKSSEKNIYATGESANTERTSRYTVQSESSKSYSMASIISTGKSNYNNQYATIKGGRSVFPSITPNSKYQPYVNSGGSNKFPIPYNGNRSYPYSGEKGGGRNYLPIPKQEEYKEPYTPSDENRGYLSPYNGSSTPYRREYYPSQTKGSYTHSSGSGGSKYTPPPSGKNSGGTYKPNYNSSPSSYIPPISGGGGYYPKKGKNTTSILPMNEGKKPDKKDSALAAKRDLLAMEDKLLSKTKVATFEESLGRGRTQLAKSNKALMISKPKDNSRNFYKAVTGKKVSKKR